MKIFVKPAGSNVLDERGRPYPDEVVQVEKTVFVKRLMNDGSLIAVAKVEKKAEKKGGEQ
jgi:hypothetical protein